MCDHKCCCFPCDCTPRTIFILVLLVQSTIISCFGVALNVAWLLYGVVCVTKCSLQDCQCMCKSTTTTNHITHAYTNQMYTRSIGCHQFQVIKILKGSYLDARSMLVFVDRPADTCTQ